MAMTITRREALLTGLFGAGWVGLRALATGLPAALLVDPRRALADDAVTCFDRSRAQYLVLSTSSAGDPLNANVPGTYGDPSIVHPADPAMAPTTLHLGGRAYTAARPWSQLPGEVLARTSFFHHATLTNSHANESKVLKLMGAVKRQEMLASLIARQLAPCLGTVQPEPACVGGEALSYQGRTLPVLTPLALRDVLTAAPGPLTQVEALRDADLARIQGVLRQGATTFQRRFLDQMVVSQTQLRSIAQDLLDSLASVRDNGPAGQIVAAIALIRMNVAPVVSIHVPFGGDNHDDHDLALESAQTVSGVARIGSLMAQLKAAGLADRVTFVAMNVFGRTLTNAQRTADRRQQGRDHYASHHCSVLIGKGVRGSVIGGVGRRATANDLAALPIRSASGEGDPGGDVAFEDTLGSVGKTIGAALGVDPAVLDDQIVRGRAISAALA